jgi:hypothetical protein
VSDKGAIILPRVLDTQSWVIMYADLAKWKIARSIG